MNGQPKRRPRRPKGAKPQPHDLAFKSLYGFRLMAGDLLEIVLPKDLLDRIDWDSLERLPEEWLSPGLDQRRGDCVWRVRLCGGGTFIFPIEFQRRLDRLMPVRFEHLLISAGGGSGQAGRTGPRPKRPSTATGPPRGAVQRNAPVAEPLEAVRADAGRQGGLAGNDAA